jgi:transposase InsO family protein
MKTLGVQGIIRGKAKKTTAPDKSQPCLKDKVNGKFRAPAPNMLWVSDFTCFSRSQGFVYVTFIIDTFADKIVGGHVSSSPKTDFVLHALEQALHDRKPPHKGSLVHHPAAVGNIYLFARSSDWPLPGLKPVLAALVVLTIMPWPQ